jgi:nucleotide-binding universal stress UspA family protein
LRRLKSDDPATRYVASLRALAAARRAIGHLSQGSDGLDEPKEPPVNMRDDRRASATNAAIARGTEGHTMAALRDITVVLDDAAPSETRLTIAIALAQQHNAYLTGLSALDLLTPARPVVQPRDPLETDAPPASPLLNLGAARPYDYSDADTQVAEKAEQIEAAFRERLRLSGVQGDWRVASGRASEAVVRQAWYADLTILGQVDPSHPPPAAGRHLVEDVLLTSGRPTLVIPYVGSFETIGTRVLVAWNNSREAARAVHDALPLLAKAASVTIMAVSPGRREPAADEANTGDLIDHLARHGISAKAERTMAAGKSIPDVLLSYAADLNADLLVAGGYGHSRLRERILGGTTHVLLQHLTVPVLMSH